MAVDILLPPDVAPPARPGDLLQVLRLMTSSFPSLRMQSNIDSMMSSILVMTAPAWLAGTGARVSLLGKLESNCAGRTIWEVRRASPSISRSILRLIVMCDANGVCVLMSARLCKTAW